MAKPARELRRRSTARMRFSVDVWWGALSAEGKKLDRCSKVIIGFPVSLPSARVKRSGPEPSLRLCVELIQKVSTID